MFVSIVDKYGLTTCDPCWQKELESAQANLELQAKQVGKKCKFWSKFEFFKPLSGDPSTPNSD